MPASGRAQPRRHRERGSVLPKVLLLLVLWVLLPLAVAEIGVRLWRPGFPGLRLPQVEHRPAEGYGFELVPGQHAFNVAEPVTVNQAGFRGPELRETGGHLRVLCLGDSFTFGYGVRDEDTYPRQLERILRERLPGRDPEVVNTGVQGYATYHEMDLLRRRGLELEPDAVVLAVYHNDLVARPPGDYTESYREELREARSSLRHRAPWLYSILHNSAAATLAMQIYHASQQSSAEAMREAADGAGADAVWRSMEHELADFARLAETHGFVPLVVAIPGRAQVLGESDGSRYPDEVLEIADRLGLGTIDLRPVLREALAEGQHVYLDWDHHHSPTGNRLLAELVAERLTAGLRATAASHRRGEGAS